MKKTVDGKECGAVRADAALTLIQVEVAAGQKAVYQTSAESEELLPPVATVLEHACEVKGQPTNLIDGSQPDSLFDERIGDDPGSLKYNSSYHAPCPILALSDHRHSNRDNTSLELSGQH